MGTFVRGRNCALKMFGSGTSCAVDLMGKWEISFNTDSLDGSYMGGGVFKRNLTGMIGWTATIDGFFDASTAAQSQIGSSGIFKQALAGTNVQDIRFYLGGTSGFFWMPAYSTSCTVQSTDAGCYLGNMRTGVDKSGLCTMSFSAEGYGPIALFNGNTSTVVVESTQS